MSDLPLPDHAVQLGGAFVKQVVHVLSLLSMQGKYNVETKRGFNCMHSQEVLLPELVPLFSREPPRGQVLLAFCVFCQRLAVRP